MLSGDARKVKSTWTLARGPSLNRQQWLLVLLPPMIGITKVPTQLIPMEWRYSTLVEVPVALSSNGAMRSVLPSSRKVVNLYMLDKRVDGCAAMLYDAAYHHCLWSVDGDDLY
jgi:hypothetical protein